MIAYIVLLFLGLLACDVRAETVVYEWNKGTQLTVNELAILKGQTFPFIDFNPPLNVREDGSKFLSVAVIDTDIWINMALNSFVSLAKFRNVSGLTIMTMNDERLGSVFRKLGLFTYDAKATIATFPEDFRLEKPLPSWSWGAIIFLRFNAWFEAFRRGIGFCSIDTDVTYNREVFFVQGHNNLYVDIATQGLVEKINSGASTKCAEYRWVQAFSDKIGYYINPGLSCHAYNERTLKFMQDFQHHIAVTIERQIMGWGQPAYHTNFCENEFEYHSPHPENYRWHWKGQLKRHNISVSIFAAPGPPGSQHIDEEKIAPDERQHVPAYHAKACHGADRGDTAARVKCKEDWLKAQGQWFLPEGLPRGLDAWLSMNETTVAALKALLHT